MADTLLQLVLDSLDRIEAPVILHRDALSYPRDQIDDLIASGILRETVPATRIPRPSRFHPGPDLIVRKTSRGFYGVADEDEYGDPVPLAEEDVRQYEVCLPKLIDRIRKENSISGSGFENVAGLIPLGTKVISGALPVWVYFSVPNGDEQTVLARCARLSVANSRPRAVMVVPNGPTFSPEARRVLGEVSVLSLWEPAKQGTLTLSWPTGLTLGGSLEGEAARIFRLDGQVWTLRFEGKTVRLQASKGLNYICQLLQCPGQVIPAAELLRIGGSPLVTTASLGSGGEILDDIAISQYRSRLVDLKAEIVEAERRNDVGRKEALENERDQITTQIRSAIGLGGRRRSRNDAERVRKAVSNSISRAIKSIRRHHPPLADHLQRFIDRGSQLIYTGDGIPWHF